MKKSRIQDLAEQPYDRSRPEIPQTVHDERRELAKLVLMALKEGFLEEAPVRRRRNG